MPQKDCNCNDFPKCSRKKKQCSCDVSEIFNQLQYSPQSCEIFDGKTWNLDDLQKEGRLLQIYFFKRCLARVRDISSPAIWATIWRRSHGRQKCRPNGLIKLIN